MKLVSPVPSEPTNVCQPSPCGPNAQCQISGNSPSCTCLPDFVGSPPNCRPECISNSECLSNQACVNQRCKDPCVGSCGANAQCRTVSHTPVCYCETGYTGDPFTQCFFRPSKNFTYISNSYYFCYYLHRFKNDIGFQTNSRSLLF